MSKDESQDPGSAPALIAAASGTEMAPGLGAPAPAPEPAAPPEQAAPGPAVAPAQEMSFSESTTHWLERGERGDAAQDLDGGTGRDRFEPTFTTRRRDLAILGAAGALAIALVLYLQGRAPPPPPPPPSRTASAATLIGQAEKALA